MLAFLLWLIKITSKWLINITRVARSYWKLPLTRFSMCDNTCLTAKHRSRADIQERSTNLILTGLSGTEKNFWRNSTGSWWYSRRNLWSNCKKEEQTVRKETRTGRRRKGRRRRKICCFTSSLLLLLITPYTFFCLYVYLTQTKLYTMVSLFALGGDC